MLIAPTEPPSLRALGTTTIFPEDYGADVFFLGHAAQKCGVQRKEISDLLSSIIDGRLTKEISQMQGLDVRLLVVEGNIRYTSEGVYMGKGFGRTWTRAQIMAVELGVQQKGVWVLHSSSLPETIEIVRLFEKWCQKEKHTSTSNRPGMAGGNGGMWGKSGATHREYGIWLMQGLPGVGPGLAERIWEKLGGIMVLRKGVGERELMEVEGIGKAKARKIMEALGK